MTDEMVRESWSIITAKESLPEFGIDESTGRVSLLHNFTRDLVPNQER